MIFVFLNVQSGVFASVSNCCSSLLSVRVYERRNDEKTHDKEGRHHTPRTTHNLVVVCFGCFLLVPWLFVVWEEERSNLNDKYVYFCHLLALFRIFYLMVKI